MLLRFEGESEIWQHVFGGWFGHEQGENKPNNSRWVLHQLGSPTLKFPWLRYCSLFFVQTHFVQTHKPVSIVHSVIVSYLWLSNSIRSTAIPRLNKLLFFIIFDMILEVQPDYHCTYSLVQIFEKVLLVNSRLEWYGSEKSWDPCCKNVQYKTHVTLAEQICTLFDVLFFAIILPPTGKVHLQAW